MSEQVKLIEELREAAGDHAHGEGYLAGLLKRGAAAIKDLHAEAEALRAENGRLAESLCVAHHNLSVGFDTEASLTSQLEAARGFIGQLHAGLRSLKESVFPDDPHGTVSMHEFIDALLAVTATPAPEVRPDLIRFDFINADDQQDSKMITHDDMRECEIQPLYTTPQPGPDVRGLVESIQAAVNAVIVPVTMTPAKAEYYKAGARHIIAKVNEALAAHRQAQRKGDSNEAEQEATR